MRRIKKAKIKFISLVPAGANLLPVIYKADGSVVFDTLTKASDTFDDTGELTSVIYAPEHRDSQGDIASKEVIKDMAYDAIANGLSIDIQHDGKPVGSDKAKIGETFLVQKTDTRFHGWKDRRDNPVNLEGAWATVIKVDDKELRQKYKNKEWTGVSMGGTAVVEEDAFDIKAALKQLILDSVTKIDTLTPDREPDMTPAELAEITKTINDGLKNVVTELAKAIKPAEAPSTPTVPSVPKDGSPVEPRDWGNARLVKKYLRECEVYQLRQSTIAVDTSLGKEFATGLAELRKAWAEEDAAEGATGALPTGPSVGAKPAAVLAKSFGGVAISPLDAALLAAGEASAKALQTTGK